ncbi:signal peptidase I [Halorubrum sp. FL23]|uniref:signal peptidase I n=1 Tax=Halorubrum sp. FL23 TaxID=3458704 RepID=UPI004034AB3F
MIQLLTSPRTKRAANVLGVVLLIALVVPFAVYAVPEVVGADESFVVLTASMTPAIAPGDVVIVDERDPTSIVEGDVITFARGTSDVPVTHRVIGVVDEGGALAFETMGDANEGPDPGLVPAVSLVGAVMLTIPYIGYVIQFAGTRVGFVTLVLLPFGLLAVTEVWSIVRGRDDAAAPVSSAEESIAEPTTEPDEEPTTEPDAEPTESGLPADASTAGGSGGVSVDAVGGAAGVLVVFAPYAVYVAFQLRTAAAIAVAVGASTLLLGALAAWLPASGVLDRGESPSEPAADDGASDPNHGGAAPSPPTTGADWEAPDVTERVDDGDADPTAAADGSGAPPPTAPTAVPAQSDGAGEGN